jgi:hypothetical protein
MAIKLAVLIAALALPERAAGAWTTLAPSDLTAGSYHVRHAEIFGKYATGFNLDVLRAVDAVQKTALDGGGYFTGVRADPPESPIGYPLALFGRPLLAPPRRTSYCSGASYAVLIEALNRIFGAKPPALTPERAEAMRMQEPDGSRREDDVKFWGHWNADHLGDHFALVQYSGMGRVVAPKDARAGDFMNIHWKTGISHSVVFLGWYVSKTEGPSMLIWSSQAATNGMADKRVPLSLVAGVKIVRLSNPKALTTFKTDAPVTPNVPWDLVTWTPPKG